MRYTHHTIDTLIQNSKLYIDEMTFGESPIDRRHFILDYETRLAAEIDRLRSIYGDKPFPLEVIDL